MTTNCPDCGQSLKAKLEATCSLDQDCRVWPMMACVPCLDRDARGYWGRRSDGPTIPVRPLRYERRSDFCSETQRDRVLENLGPTARPFRRQS